MAAISQHRPHFLSLLTHPIWFPVPIATIAAHGDAFGADVDRRMVGVDPVEPADRIHETSAVRQGSGPEQGARAFAQHAPIFDAG